MTAALRARRLTVPVDEHDYADAYEIRLRPSDRRTPEEFARCALEEAPWLVRTVIWVAHRCVLRLRLAPRSSSEHVLGWTIVTSTPDALRLEATSPLLGRGVIVGRRTEATRAVITTYVFFARPVLSRAIWTAVGPLHRRVAPYLMERAARA